VVWKVLFFIVRAVFLIVLPFIVLIRGAVYLNTSQEFGIWPSLGGGVIITTILLFIYMTFIYGKVTGKVGLHAIVFISNDNIKTSDIKEEYSELHPFLRLGIGTILKIDSKLVVTDGQRAPEDYEKMGLKSKKQSLHYKQKDGFTYAIDLRTNDRSEWRNQAIAIYFGAMGFNVLRHVGTADHLHISMKCKYLPGAK